MATRPRIISILAVVAVIFGAMTLKEGGTVLFGGEAARAAAGQYVPFVLWFNFLAGFAYLAAGLGLWFGQAWAPRLAAAIAVGSLVVFVALGLHIAGGGAYETRTVAAMTLRTGLWAGIALVASRHRPKPLHSA